MFKIVTGIKKHTSYALLLWYFSF